MFAESLMHWTVWPLAGIKNAITCKSPLCVALSTLEKEWERERAQDERFVCASSCINIWDGLCSKYLPPNGKHIWVLPGHVRSIESCFRNLSDLFAAGRQPPTAPDPAEAIKQTQKSIAKYIHTQSYLYIMSTYIKKTQAELVKNHFLFIWTLNAKWKIAQAMKLHFLWASLAPQMLIRMEREGEARAEDLDCEAEIMPVDAV